MLLHDFQTARRISLLIIQFSFHSLMFLSKVEHTFSFKIASNARTHTYTLLEKHHVRKKMLPISGQRKYKEKNNFFMDKQQEKISEISRQLKKSLLLYKR